jgi:ribosomal protein L25 (general stress protein Ctc)
MKTYKGEFINALFSFDIKKKIELFLVKFINFHIISKNLVHLNYHKIN